MIQVMAHRGSSGYAPENTLQAFRLAVSMKADGIECDIHRSADGVFVVCHDDTIDRTSDGTGRIAEMTYEAITKHNFSCHCDPAFEYKAPETAPTLEQMLDVVKDMDPINIEIKEFFGDETAALNAFYDILKQYGIIKQVIVSSFNVDLLKRLKDLHSDLYTGYLYNIGQKKKSFPIYPAERSVETAVERSCNAIHPKIDDLTKEIVDDAHNHGLDVNVWTVNTPEAIQKAIDLGVDGIITNYPDRVLAVLGR
ncbi:MAG: hypothetical protein MJ099_04500 [Clostridia bacterium]|nr:hypothetical protein [Clostridia bacterium]